MDDPLHPVKSKLDEIHQDVKDIKGEFQSVHDRMDREVNERAWSLERLWQGLTSIRADILSLFRHKP